MKRDLGSRADAGMVSHFRPYGSSYPAAPQRGGGPGGTCSPNVFLEAFPMRKLSLTLLLLLAFSALSIGGLKAVGGTTPIWPAVDTQLAKDHVQPGSALEKLIRAN